MAKQTTTEPLPEGADIVKMHERCRLSRLKVYKKNPRINDSAVDACMVSMQKHGKLAPILVDEDYRICCGHTRLKAKRIREGVSGKAKKQSRRKKGTR